MFTYDDKVLKNDIIEDISITLELGEEFKKNDWKENERYVHKELIKSGNTISMPIECPISDLIYLQPEFSGKSDIGCYIKTEEDYKHLENAYNKVKEVFSDKKVSINIHSNNLSDKYNEVTLDFDEFKKCYKLEVE